MIGGAKVGWKWRAACRIGPNRAVSGLMAGFTSFPALQIQNYLFNQESDSQQQTVPGH